MLAGIDGDIVTYRIGFTTEDSDEAIACWRADELNAPYEKEIEEYFAKEKNVSTD